MESTGNKSLTAHKWTTELQTLLKQFVPVCVVLAIPIVPFLLFGDSIRSWLPDTDDPWLVSGAIVLLLSGDIFLPIPSSVVSTLGGGQIDWLIAAFASWTGLTIGAIVGFIFAKRWGPRFASRFSSPEELERAELLTQKYGPAVLIFARGVPVLAESSVLLMGVHQLSFKRFIWPVVLSNLGISLAYSKFGDIADQHGWFPLAMGVSIGLPVILTLLVQRYFKVIQPKSTLPDNSDC